MFCVGWIFFWVAFFKSVNEESACLYDGNFGQSLHINLFQKYYTTWPRLYLSLSSHYGIIKSFDKQKLSFTRVQRIIQKAPDKLNLLKNLFPIPCHSITKFSISTGCPITIPPPTVTFERLRILNVLWHMLIFFAIFGGYTPHYKYKVENRGTLYFLKCITFFYNWRKPSVVFMHWLSLNVISTTFLPHFQVGKSHHLALKIFFFFFCSTRVWFNCFVIAQ